MGTTSVTLEGSHDQGNILALLIGKVEMQSVEVGKLRALVEDLRSEVVSLEGQVQRRQERVDDLEQ